MKKYSPFIIILFTCLSVSLLYADGTYYIDKDENGFYMQTERDGSWYVFRDDVKDLKVGQKGTYAIRTDQDGSYIVTDNHGELTIDRKSTEQLAQEIMGYNGKSQWEAEQRKCKVVIKGNRVLVPVVLGYGENEIKAFLLLDTGASITALHKDIADQLDIKPSQKARFRLIGGSTFTSHITKLNYVNVGPLKKQGIYAVIIEHEGPPVPWKGLLGMNFLRNLEFRIDFKGQFIEWKQST
jgi:predicted aspartyl protease